MCYRCARAVSGGLMSLQILPRDLKRALELIKADPTRGWTIGELAKSCGMAPRTLQKRFQQFIGRGPLGFLRDLRLDLVRKELVAASRSASVTEIATRAGFNHLSRFAAEYSRRYGRNPIGDFAPIARNTERCSVATSSPLHGDYPADSRRTSI